MKDYYEILGITEEEKKLTGDAFNDVCKKKYHTLAMKYHPDRWANKSDAEKKEAEEKFKDIAEANEILSDPQKRAKYDNGGSDFDFDGFDPMDMFMRMQGGFGGSPFEGFFGRRTRRVNKGSNIETDVSITLQEAYKGCEKEVSINKSVKCFHCNGTGFSDGKNHDCKVCGGHGFVTESKQIGNTLYQSSTPCKACFGTGKDRNAKQCNRCNGTGYETEIVKETIEIPAGIGDNMGFVVKGLGNEPEGGGINGDLIVRVHVLEDNYFKRPDVINLVHYEYVPFNEVMLGFKKNFKCIDGTEVTVNCKELTKPGETFFFKGKGMPDPNNPSVYGDYAIVINYKLPNKLTSKQKEMLKNFYNN